jgi:butyrate kinase
VIERILVLNPGTTSTKVAVYDGHDLVWGESISHDAATLHSFGTVAGQLDYRFELINKDIPDDARGWTVVVGRGGLLRPLEGGIYAVNQSMLEDAGTARHGEHASNLGSLLAKRFADSVSVPAYVVDPVTTDEFGPVSRVSGVPGIERKCRAHALNIKAVARRTAQDLEIPFDKSRFVVAHLGGGISIAALEHGRIKDVNDGLLGMGPFSPERSGALPLQGVLDLVHDKGLDEAKRIFSKESGFVGYFGTSDLRDVELRIETGDRDARLVFRAMVYQIAKEIGAMAAALSGDMNGVILTGGLVHSERLRDLLTGYISWLPGGVHLHAGEEEMLAMAEGGLRVLNEEEEVKVY